MGDDIRKWKINYQKRWLIFTRRGTDINAYPAIKDHLEKWKKELKPRPRDWPSDKLWPGRKPGSYDWHEIQDEVAYHLEFEKPKIVLPDICKESRFSFDQKNSFVGNTGYIIPVQDFFLLGVLNSACVWWFAKKSTNFSCLGDPEDGGRLRFVYQSIVTIPIPAASAAEQAALSGLVDGILAANHVVNEPSDFVLPIEQVMLTFNVVSELVKNSSASLRRGLLLLVRIEFVCL
jgi:hypothetical protein